MSFAFFKFLFSPRNFMFTFGMSGFVAFPHLDKLSIPQRGEGRNIVVASLIFPLSHSGGFQTHPDFFFCSVNTSFTWVSNTRFSGVWYFGVFLTASRLPPFSLFLLGCFDALPSLPPHYIVTLIVRLCAVDSFSTTLKLIVLWLQSTSH